MPNRSKQKGTRAELQIVELLRAAGLEAYRVPLSGSAIGFKSDIHIRLGAEILKIESKVQSKGFSRLYKWLAGVDLAVVKADYKPALAIIELERLVDILHQIPRKDIEKAAGKTLSETASNTEEENNEHSGNLLEVTGAKINPPRLTTLRVANEDDLRRRDEELEADRAKYLG